MATYGDNDLRHQLIWREWARGEISQATSSYGEVSTICKDYIPVFDRAVLAAQRTNREQAADLRKQIKNGSKDLIKDAKDIAKRAGVWTAYETAFSETQRELQDIAKKMQTARSNYLRHSSADICSPDTEQALLALKDEISAFEVFINKFILDVNSIAAEELRMDSFIRIEQDRQYAERIHSRIETRQRALMIFSGVMGATISYIQQNHGEPAGAILTATVIGYLSRLPYTHGGEFGKHNIYSNRAKAGLTAFFISLNAVTGVAGYTLCKNYMQAAKAGQEQISPIETNPPSDTMQQNLEQVPK